MRRALLVCILVMSSNVYARILIFTYSHNRPDFIELQYKTFKKFLRDDYEFIVFNDAVTNAMRTAIEKMCARYGICCLRIPQEIHRRPYLKRWPGEHWNHPAVRNCNVVQYSLDVLGFKHDDIVALFDSDLFLVKPFSIRQYLAGFDLAGLGQGRLGPKGSIDYLWIGLVFLNMKTMPNKTSINFNCGLIDDVPVDAGGHTHYYLKQNPRANVRYIDCLTEMNGCITEDEIFHASKDMVFKVPCAFLHYGSGTNWDRRSDEYHTCKTRVLKNIIEEVLCDDKKPAMVKRRRITERSKAYSVLKKYR